VDTAVQPAPISSKLRGEPANVGTSDLSFREIGSIQQESECLEVGMENVQNCVRVSCVRTTLNRSPSRHARCCGEGDWRTRGHRELGTTQVRLLRSL